VFHIHIGAHKVGSTSLQRFFALNTGLLEDLGIIYPEVGFGTFAHHPLAKAFTESKHVEARGALKAALARLASESPDKTFLLSSEVFEFARSEGIAELAEAIAPHKAQILFYVRDFTKMIPSKYAQRTKTGANHKNFDEFLDIAHEMRWLSFTKIVTRWAEQFGWDAMRVQVLDRETLVHGDLLRDAWSALGLPADAFDRCDPSSLEPVNTSPNWVALEAVREVNRKLSNAELDLPTDQKTRGLRRTKALEEARFAVEGLRVGKLLDICEQATKDVRLAERPGQYLNLQQWTTLDELFRAEIERLNQKLPGPPVMAPASRPPPERAFLPQFSELTEQERARMGRRVLAALAVKRLPRPVTDTIASAFDVKRGGRQRIAALQETVWTTSGQLQEAFSGKPPRVSHKKELAAARAAHAARRRAEAAEGGAVAGEGGKAARPRAERPPLMRRIIRKITRWSRRFRGESRPTKTKT
jgi:hypothetical protein